VQAQTALAARLDDGPTVVELTRRTLLAYAALVSAPAQRLAFDLALSAGAVSFRRVTDRVAADLSPTHGVDTLAFGAGLELRARYTLWSSPSAALALELSARALVVPAAPLLRYERDGTLHSRALWPVQPELLLGPRLRVRL